MSHNHLLIMDNYSYNYNNFPGRAEWLDSKLIGLHTKAAELWQNRTYQSKDKLKTLSLL